MPGRTKAPAKTKKRARGAESAAGEPSAPKTTRPDADERRDPEQIWSAADRMGRTLDAFPDRIDIRDWFYQPRLAPLPDQIINIHQVPYILDQGTDGACTGYALAAVVNYLLGRRGLKRSVSPRMLYEMARRYDEWPGEEYEGSSARGAMKGWVRHGVCEERHWSIDMKGPHYLNLFADAEQGVDAVEKLPLARLAMQTPGGAFYRVMHRQVRDMHAALHEVGILYCTLMVHSGWDQPSGTGDVISYTDAFGNIRTEHIPVIVRRGRADSGHAIAIVGYTSRGFVIQNSWGESWGAGGFALLPYEDFLLHAVDVWVAQLGVPVDVDVWIEDDTADSTASLGRVDRAVPLADIRPYVINVGNNGELSDSGDYWTTREDLRTLFTQTIPERTKDWEKKRILLYLHGGLNSERAVAKRIVAFRDKMLLNEIYPVHLMWETGFMETLTGIVSDNFTDVDERAGSLGKWWSKLREGLVEAKDRTFELTTAATGAALWREMKENARLASFHPDKKGAMQIVAQFAKDALSALDDKEKKNWELHVVAHSAGSIFAAYALQYLCKMGIPLKSVQLMAPAITTGEFHKLVMPVVQAGGCPQPSLYILSDVGERDDTVTMFYGKSLLYLVSNAFEQKRDTPLLGMERFVRYSESGEWNASLVDKDLDSLFRKQVDGRPSLIVAGEGKRIPDLSRSDSHGGFDNDVDTLNSVLWRILDKEPVAMFKTRDLQY